MALEKDMLENTGSGGSRKGRGKVDDEDRKLQVIYFVNIFPRQDTYT